MTNNIPDVEPFRVKAGDRMDPKIFNDILERLDELEKIVTAMALEIVPEYKV